MKELFDKRLHSAMIQISRYSRYIFNDHINLILLFVIALSAYFYSQWLKTLHSGIPYFLITACIMAFVVVFGRVITFLEKADEVYLLPLEKQLKGYFERSVIITFLVHLLPLLFFTLVSIPFLMKAGFGSKSQIIGYVTLLLVLKYTQLQYRLLELYSISEFKGRLSQLVRYILLVSIIYFYLKDAWLYVAIVFIIWLGLLIYFLRKKENSLFKWYDAISYDQERWSKFYRFAQAFTDVPNLPVKIKRRRIGNNFYTKKKITPFMLLFDRAFVRGQNYGPMMLRLCLIGVFIIFVLPYQFTALVVGTICYYLIGYQLLPMYVTFDFVPWTSIYPFSNKDKMRSFRRLFEKITVVVWAVFAIGALLFQAGLLYKLVAVFGLVVTYFLLWKFYFLPKIYQEKDKRK